MAIQTRALGRTGAAVTILGYGAMELRGLPRGPEITDQEAGRLLNAVLDGGVNLIDTSPDYGRSEELIGAFIGHRRDEFFLASKCGCPLEQPTDVPPPYPHDYSAANVRADVEQSLGGSAPTVSTWCRYTCRRARPRWPPAVLSRPCESCRRKERSASWECRAFFRTCPSTSP